MNSSSSSDKLFNVTFVSILFLSTLYIKFNYSSSEISDYDAYAYFIDIYWRGWDKNWLVSEPLGWGSLLALRALTGSTDQAIVIAHWLLSIFTCAAILAVAIFYRLKWQGVLLSIAMFGPLLSMVTIRATPAYLLCVAATLTVSKRPLTGLGLVAFAILFHNTAILALGPIILIIFQQKLPGIASVLRNRALLAAFSATIAIIVLLFREDVFGALQNIFSFSPGFMQKYLVYFLTGDTDVTFNGLQQETSIFHILFIVGATLIFITYIVLGDAEQAPYTVFIVASFAIFIALSSNPVISYRQSIFWVIPGLLTFPWTKLKPHVIAAMGVIAFSLIVFPLNVDGVLLRW